MKKRQSCECIVNKENPYKLQVGDMHVEIKYSNYNKKLNECMLNILNKKNKMG